MFGVNIDLKKNLKAAVKHVLAITQSDSFGTINQLLSLPYYLCLGIFGASSLVILFRSLAALSFMHPALFFLKVFSSSLVILPMTLLVLAFAFFNEIPDTYTLTKVQNGPNAYQNEERPQVLSDHDDAIVFIASLFYCVAFYFSCHDIFNVTFKSIEYQLKTLLTVMSVPISVQNVYRFVYIASSLFFCPMTQFGKTMQFIEYLVPGLSADSGKQETSTKSQTTPSFTTRASLRVNDVLQMMGAHKNLFKFFSAVFLGALFGYQIALVSAVAMLLHHFFASRFAMVPALLHNPIKKLFHGFSIKYVTDWRFSSAAMILGSVLYAMPDAIAMYGLLGDIAFMNGIHSMILLPMLMPLARHRSLISGFMFAVTFVKRIVSWRISLEQLCDSEQAVRNFCGTSATVSDIQNGFKQNRFYKFVPNDPTFKNNVTDVRLIMKMLISLLSVMLISNSNIFAVAIVCPIAYMLMENVKNYAQHLGVRRNVPSQNTGKKTDTTELRSATNRICRTLRPKNDHDRPLHPFEVVCYGLFSMKNKMCSVYHNPSGSVGH